MVPKTPLLPPEGWRLLCVTRRARLLPDVLHAWTGATADVVHGQVKGGNSYSSCWMAPVIVAVSRTGSAAGRCCPGGRHANPGGSSPRVPCRMTGVTCPSRTRYTVTIAGCSAGADAIRKNARGSRNLASTTPLPFHLPNQEGHWPRSAFCLPIINGWLQRLPLCWSYIMRDRHRNQGALVPCSSGREISQKATSVSADQAGVDRDLLTPCTNRSGRESTRAGLWRPAHPCRGSLSVLFERNMNDLRTRVAVERGLCIHCIRDAVPAAILRYNADMPDAVAGFVVDRPIPVPLITLPRRSRTKVRPLRLGPGTLPAISPIMHPDITGQAAIAVQDEPEQTGQTTVLHGVADVSRPGKLWLGRCSRLRFGSRFLCWLGLGPGRGPGCVGRRHWRIRRQRRIGRRWRRPCGGWRKRCWRWCMGRQWSIGWRRCVARDRSIRRRQRHRESRLRRLGGCGCGL